MVVRCCIFSALRSNQENLEQSFESSDADPLWLVGAAPEILQDLPYGPKVDVFSSGVILFTLLAGFPPFRGQNVKEILKRNLR